MPDGRTPPRSAIRSGGGLAQGGVDQLAPRRAGAAAEHGIQLEVVKLPDAQGPRQGFVLLPKRWVVERSFAWLAWFRRLARDYERLPQAGAGLTFLAFTCLMLQQVTHLPFIATR